MADLRDKIAAAIGDDENYELDPDSAGWVLDGYRAADAVLAVLDLDTERAEAQVGALREVRRAVSEEQSAAFHDGIRRVEFMLGVTEVLTALDYRADRIAREAGIEAGGHR